MKETLYAGGGWSVWHSVLYHRTTWRIMAVYCVLLGLIFTVFGHFSEDSWGKGIHRHCYKEVQWGAKLGLLSMPHHEDADNNVMPQTASSDNILLPYFLILTYSPLQMFNVLHAWVIIMNQGVFVYPQAVKFLVVWVQFPPVAKSVYWKSCVCTLTRCRRGVQVHLLTVLPVARLVAASHTQHVHAVHLQPVDHSAAPTHFIQSLPAPAGSSQSSSDPTSRGSSWNYTPTAILDREVPGRCRVLGESPAQEELIVGQGALGIDHWSQGSCDKHGHSCVWSMVIYTSITS